MNRSEPIDRLCKLIDLLPDNAWGRTWARYFTSYLLGIRMQRTGLDATPNRNLGQLFWDYETAEVRERMNVLTGFALSRLTGHIADETP